MSRINDLIKELCPNGVEYKKLSDVIPVNRGSRLTKSQLSEDGIYEVYHGSKDVPLGKYDKYNTKGDTVIVVNTGGIGGVKYLKNNFWCSDGSFNLGHNDRLNNKYLYHYLLQYEKYFLSQKRVGGVPTIDRSVVENVRLPLPPLEVQEEIVRVLDKFGDLEAELEAELEARKNQYEFWRGRVFKSGDYINLSELSEIGTGSSNTNQALPKGKYPFYTRSQEVYYMDEYEYDDESIITAGDGAGVGKSIHYVNGKYALHQRAYRICPNSNKILPKYLYYYMKDNFYNYILSTAVSSSVTSIRRKMLDEYPIPVVSIDEQKQIISILNRFDTLINDITVGIPAEIELRRKQYEYYRNKLLSFEELSVSE